MSAPSPSPPSGAPGFAFRPHIEALRAVAVLSVMFRHFGWPFFGGGFVGVDVFFVISGFLIAGGIYRETERGAFSLLSFYERRIRRILPAFAVVTLAVLVLSLRLLWPFQLLRTAEAAISAATFSANIWFYRTTDYFLAASGMTPLLHTWSLSIEEQFYLVFPLLLMGLEKLKIRRVGAVLAGLLVLSLVGSEVTRRLDVAAAFYLTPFRAFELLIGAVLARCRFSAERRGVFPGFPAAAGLALIVFSVVFFGRGTPFPGLPALVPCLGAALVIAAGELGDSAVLRVFSNRGFLFVGRISYSLYLVHWPVFVFAGTMGEIDPLVLMLGGPLVSVALAAILHAVVEQPPRYNRRLFSRPVLFASAFVCVGAVLGLAQAVIDAGGYPRRLPPQVRRILEVQFKPEYFRHFQWGSCFFTMEDDPSTYDAERCFPRGRKTVFLWGDSTIAHYYEGLVPLFKTRGYSVGLAGMGSCPPLPGLAQNVSSRCARLSDRVLSLALERKPELVILGALWRNTAGEDKPFLEVLRRLRQNGSAVIVLGNPRYLKAFAPHILAERMENDSAYPEDIDLVDEIPRFDAIDAQLWNEIALYFPKDPKVLFLPLTSVIYTRDLKLSAGDDIYFIDDIHFTEAGSRHFGRILFDAILRIWTPEPP
ncbi:MAG: acyltransferase [Methylobacteriaceae bacterium]|jgi:peptidoglycan/LPS O-acetylase OafA/YrhL|nr:acyltransferase [Methylobacteriaceae bacterium]